MTMKMIKRNRDSQIIETLVADSHILVNSVVLFGFDCILAFASDS